MNIYKAEKLREFLQDVFVHCGMQQAEAMTASNVLVAADLRGIDSHGVARLSGYIRLWESGRVNMKPKWKVVYETTSTVTIDADQGLGLTLGQEAMKFAIKKAKDCGTGWVAVKNSNHFGIAACHSMLALEHDMIGISMTNASPLVAPTHSIERMLGTNPMCFAIPAKKYNAIVVDFATAAAANGKLEIAQREGKPIPHGWVQTKDGQPSTNPHELKNEGSLLPLGSDRDHGSHKGYGLGAVVDIFSAILSGANYGPWVPPFVSFLPVLPDSPGAGIGHFFGAMRVDAFRPIADYYENIDRWIERFKAAKPEPGFERVIIPGEPESEMETERLVTGIPLNELVEKDLISLGEKFGIAW